MRWESRVGFPAETTNCFMSKTSKPFLMPANISIRWIRRLFPVVRRPGRESNHLSPPFSAQVNNNWNCISAFLMYVHDVHKDGFTFTFYLSYLKNSSFILKYSFISKERKTYLKASVHIKRSG